MYNLVACNHWPCCEITSPQKGTLHPLSNHSSFPLSLRLLQLPSYLLSSWICLFWVFHRNRIFQYVACCCLASFILAECFQGLAMLSMDQYFIPVYGWIVHCMGIPHFVYSNVNGHLGCLSLLAIMKSAAINICMQIWTPDFNSFGCILRS